MNKYLPKFFLAILLLFILAILLFHFCVRRSSMDELSFPGVAAEDIRLMKVSSRWEGDEYCIEDAGFFAELLGLFRKIELRPLLMAPSDYHIEQANAYWFYCELEDGRQSVFKIMDGKLVLQVSCGEISAWTHYAITSGEDVLPEILQLLKKYKSLTSELCSS